MTSVSWGDLQKAAGEAGFDPVPAGPYDVIVDSATAKKAGTGKDMITCQFRVQGGPYDGKIIFNQFVLSPENPNALAFFFRHMAAMGLGEAYFASNPQLERVAADLQGRACRITVSVREWNDTMRNQVDAVAAPAGGPRAAAATPAASLGTAPMPSAARTAANVPSVTPSTPKATSSPATPSTPPPPPSAPAIGDDDVPF